MAENSVVDSAVRTEVFMHSNRTALDSDSKKPSKPYAMVGAGRLAATIWKTGCDELSWRYRFNLFRLGSNGRVGQRLRPGDLKNVVKLVQVLAATLADDGCFSAAERRELELLASRLDEITRGKH